MSKSERVKYTAEDYAELNIGEYRDRFPDETANLSDVKLFNIVMGTDDDMDDDEWRTLLKQG